MDENNLSENIQEVAEPVQETNTEPVETSESVENVEVAEPQVEEKPVQSKEENAFFAEQRRAREAAEAKASQLEKDIQIAKKYGAEYGIFSEEDIAKTYGASHGINNLEQFEQALEVQKYKAKGFSDEEATEYADLKREKAERAKQEARQKDYQNFIKVYSTVKAEEIPAEVWEANAQGTPLVDAYARYENKLLKQKLDEFTKGQQAQMVNKNNAKNTPGSVTTQGVDTSDFISKDVFDANKNNSNWLYKNYELLEKSKLNWK